MTASLRCRIAPGDLYAVPLPGGGYCIAVIIIKGQGPFMLSQFFVTKFDTLPTEREAVGRIDNSEKLPVQHGPLGIKDGTWVLIGHYRDFGRPDWRQLRFYNAWMDSVAELDPVTLHPAYKRVTNSSDRALPEDGGYGHLAIAMEIAKLLGVDMSPYEEQIRREIAEQAKGNENH